MEEDTMHDKRTGMCLFKWSVTLAMLATRTASAQVPPAPDIDVQSNGNFIVSYREQRQCLSDGLQESSQQTNRWEYVGSGSFMVSNRAPGTYRYRVACVAAVSQGAYAPIYGPEASVLVDDSAQAHVSRRPTLVSQFDTDYSIFSGDLDNDNRRELLIRSISANTAGKDGMVGNVLLRQNRQGLLTPSLPTADELAIAANWLPVDVEIAKRDVNIDGYLDLVLLGVDDNPGFGQVANQILFAPGVPGRDQSPSVVAVDDALARFSNDIDRQLIDPEYFQNNAPTRYAAVSYYALNCGWPRSAYNSVADAYFSWACIVEPQYYYLAYRDYSVFDPFAMEIASNDYGMIHGSQTTETGMRRIADTIATVLGVPVGGWDINELLGVQDGVSEESERQGMGLFSALAGISEAVAQVAGDSTANVTTEQVELKGRRVLGQGPFHTALEFRESTVSAYDSDPRALFDGRLVSEVNWPRDHPSLTLQMGFVNGPTAPPIYWSDILQTDSRYGDDLPYDLFPSIGQGGYNSNSFVSGLIQTTHGTPTIDIATFVGGERPVPSSAFN
jgi:hypothetical protein